MLWLHCDNEKLRQAQVGEAISVGNPKDNGKSIFWKCKQADVETAVGMGLAKADDFLVLTGLSVWKKRQIGSTGQSKSPVDLESSFTPVDIGAIPLSWKLLKSQEPLNSKNAAENLETANAAWMLAGDASWLSSRCQQGPIQHMSTQEQQTVQRLANSALERCFKTFML